MPANDAVVSEWRHEWTPFDDVGLHEHGRDVRDASRVPRCRAGLGRREALPPSPERCGLVRGKRPASAFAGHADRSARRRDRPDHRRQHRAANGGTRSVMAARRRDHHQHGRIPDAARHMETDGEARGRTGEGRGAPRPFPHGGRPDRRDDAEDAGRLGQPRALRRRLAARCRASGGGVPGEWSAVRARRHPVVRRGPDGRLRPRRRFPGLRRIQVAAEPVRNGVRLGEARTPATCFVRHRSTGWARMRQLRDSEHEGSRAGLQREALGCGGNQLRISTST